MPNEVKFSWRTGFRLAFTAYQPDGTGRGIPDQPLPELRDTGYYHATPLTALEENDVVQAHILHTVAWEDTDVIYVEVGAQVFWEDEQVFWEEDWVFDLDTSINETVTWKGRPVGAAEVTFDDGAIEELFDQGNRVLVVEDTRQSVQPDIISESLTIENVL